MPRWVATILMASMALSDNLKVALTDCLPLRSEGDGRAKKASFPKSFLLSLTILFSFILIFDNRFQGSLLIIRNIINNANFFSLSS
jgi:hypothetical protein